MNVTLILFCALLVSAACAIYFFPVKARRGILLLVSLAFFFVGGKWAPVYALAVTILSYVVGRMLEKHRNKIVLWIGILGILAFLLVFKYINQWTDMGFAVPMGLSYYTLMAVGYLIEVFKGNRAEKNISRYSLFLMFFPQVMAGPIGRSKDLLPQWEKGPVFQADRVRAGFLMLLTGLFQKLVLADNLGTITNQILGSQNEKKGILLFIGILFYTLQIYFDFAGYSLIAIGGANMLGIRLMTNFNAPFYSCSIKEFWRRWHISLSSWFRDYLYIPLGGNRISKRRTDFNVFLVFVFSGIWHGTSLGFLLWGCIHGVYQIVSGHTRDLRSRVRETCHLSGAPYRVFQRILVFILVALAFIPFRLDSVTEILYFSKSSILSMPVSEIADFFNHIGITVIEAGILCGGILSVFILDYVQMKSDIYIRFAGLKYGYRLMIYSVLFILILCAGVYGASYNAANFIYGQF